MANSIYNVQTHDSNKSYTKNNVVMVRQNIGDSNIPKNLKYYYA